MKALSLLIALLATLLPAWSGAAVVGEPLHYQAADVSMHGYLAYDDRFSGPRPAVLVVHEWWGHNEYARSRARQLAELGYLALAVDMYGEGQQADHPQDAGKFASALRSNMALAQQRFEAAMKVLQEHPLAGGKIAAIGYCLGGGVVLEMARRGLDLAAVVSFHGSLTTATPATAGVVKAQVLVLNGADDPMVSTDHIAAFQQEMDQAGVEYQFVNYPGAKHAFTNPEADRLGQQFGLPLAYDPAADRQSWQQMTVFLQDALANQGID